MLNIAVKNAKVGITRLHLWIQSSAFITIVQSLVDHGSLKSQTDVFKYLGQKNNRFLKKLDG